MDSGPDVGCCLPAFEFEQGVGVETWPGSTYFGSSSGYGRQDNMTAIPRSDLFCLLCMSKHFRADSPIKFDVDIQSHFNPGALDVIKINPVQEEKKRCKT